MQLSLFSGETDAMSVTRRKDGGAWQVTVGKHRHSDCEWSRADALLYEAKLLKHDEHTLEEALNIWIDEYLPHLRSKDNYTSKIKALRPYLKHATCTDAGDVARTLKREWKHLQPATINRRLALLKRLVKLAYEQWGWTDAPHWKKIKLIPERNERHHYLSRAEVERLRMNCSNPDAGDLIVFAAFTGLRRSEVFRVRARDVVNGSLLLDARTKNGRPRSVPLHPRALHIAMRMPLAITPALLTKQWDRARCLLQLRDIHWHDLRHTFASWLVQQGTPLTVVRDLLGHTSIKTTERYSHLAPDNLKQAVMHL